MSSWTLVPEGGPPKKLTTPPLRTISTAHSQVAGSGDGLDDDVGATAFAGEGAGGGDDVAVGDADDLAGTEDLRGLDLVAALDDGDDVDAGELGDVHEHEADGTGADDDHGVAGLGAALFEAADDAGKRFGEGGMLEGNIVGDEEGIFFDDAGGDAEVLGVGAVVEDEILAEVLLVVAAEVAAVAGGGVEGDDAVALFELRHAGADLGDDAGELVAKEDGRLEHHGVVAAAIDLEVGSAGERGAHLDDDLARPGLGDGDTLEAEVFFAVQDCRIHLKLHRLYFLTSGCLRPIPKRNAVKMRWHGIVRRNRDSRVLCPVHLIP